jgi:hypothetical protein
MYMQKSTKTESVAEFLARGGQIKKVPMKQKNARRAPKEQVEEQEVDMSQLPVALQIKYGVRK